MTEIINNKNTLFFISIYTILVALVFKLIANYSSSYEVLYTLCLQTLLIFFLIMYNLIKWQGTIFRIVTLFILLFFLYLEGQVMLNVFDLTTSGLLSHKFNTFDLTMAITDVHLFIGCFLFGVTTVKSRKVKIRNAEINLEDKKAIQVGIIFLFLSLPFELYVNFSKLIISQSEGYAALYQEAALNSISSSVKILSYFFLPSCLYILFASKRKSFLEYTSIFLILVHALIELMIGYRASAIIPILLFLYAFSIKNQYVKSIKIREHTKNMIKKICILLLIIIIFVFPYVRSTRNNNESETFFNAFNLNNYQELFTTVNDMGKSLQTVVYTKQLVPEDYNFRFGISYLMNITTAIPNLFWDIHPAEKYGSLGKWITERVDYEFYQFGGSLGFSCVAEAYINFGYFGIVFIGFLLGKILQTIETKIFSSGSAVLYTSFAIVAINLLSYPRGEFGDVVRGIFWYMLVPFVFYKFVMKGAKI